MRDNQRYFSKNDNLLIFRQQLEVVTVNANYLLVFYIIYIYIIRHMVKKELHCLVKIDSRIFFQGYSHLTVALLVSFDVDVPPYFFKSQSTPTKSNFSCTLSKNNTIQCMKNYHSKYPFRSYCSDVTDDRLCKQRVQLYFFLQRRFSPIND